LSQSILVTACDIAALLCVSDKCLHFLLVEPLGKKYSTSVVFFAWKVLGNLV